MIVKRLGPMSFAKVLGFLYGGLGLLAGFIFSFISLMAGLLGSGSSDLGIMFGLGSIIFIPIIYGLMGFLAGALTAWLYNLVADRVGGFEIEFEDDKPSQMEVNNNPSMT